MGLLDERERGESRGIAEMGDCRRKEGWKGEERKARASSNSSSGEGVVKGHRLEDAYELNTTRSILSSSL